MPLGWFKSIRNKEMPTGNMPPQQGPFLQQNTQQPGGPSGSGGPGLFNPSFMPQALQRFLPGMGNNSLPIPPGLDRFMRRRGGGLPGSSPEWGQQSMPVRQQGFPTNGNFPGAPVGSQEVKKKGIKDLFSRFGLGKK
ncbi:MAG: hypothetical protein ACYCVD_11270 [Desulfitobacteriaceae bacterium]